MSSSWLLCSSLIFLGGLICLYLPFNFSIHVSQGFFALSWKIPSRSFACYYVYFDINLPAQRREGKAGTNMKFNFPSSSLSSMKYESWTDSNKLSFQSQNGCELNQLNFNKLIFSVKSWQGSMVRIIFHRQISFRISCLVSWEASTACWNCVTSNYYLNNAGNHQNEFATMNIWTTFQDRSHSAEQVYWVEFVQLNGS